MIFFNPWLSRTNFLKKKNLHILGNIVIGSGSSPMIGVWFCIQFSFTFYKASLLSQKGGFTSQGFNSFQTSVNIITPANTYFLWHRHETQPWIRHRQSKAKCKYALCVHQLHTQRAYLRLIFNSQIYAAECPLMSHLQTADYWFRIYSFNPVTLDEDKSVSPQTSAHTHGFIYVYPRTSQATLWERFTNLMEGQLMHLDDYIQNHIERFFLMQFCQWSREKEFAKY